MNPQITQITQISDKGELGCDADWSASVLACRAEASDPLIASETLALQSSAVFALRSHSKLNMKIEGLTPILNVSNIVESFVWFEKLGWTKAWDWGEPPSFGAVCNDKVQIFLCQGGQGSRGGPMPKFVGDDGTGGVWMSWWLESPAAVDGAHELALKHGLTVTMPPTDEPWNVREFHLRHPDGHTFRVSAGLGED